MQTKILLLSLSVAAISGCSTAYKSGQTPDDVYYSPVRYTEEKDYREERDQAKKETPNTDYTISMGIRDRRWRDFRDDYDYDNSPYYYTCSKYNYGYYYNPYYYPWAIYTGKLNYSKPVNSTPRMVNLNSYKNYSSTVANGKLTGTNTGYSSANRYNNSNDNSGKSRITLFPRNSSSSSNDTRTYSPSSSGSSGGSSSGRSSSSGSSVSRPGRGG